MKTIRYAILTLMVVALAFMVVTLLVPSELIKLFIKIGRETHLMMYPDIYEDILLELHPVMENSVKPLLEGMLYWLLQPDSSVPEDLQWTISDYFVNRYWLTVNIFQYLLERMLLIAWAIKSMAYVLVAVILEVLYLRKYFSNSYSPTRPLVFRYACWIALGCSSAFLVLLLANFIFFSPITLQLIAGIWLLSTAACVAFYHR